MRPPRQGLLRPRLEDRLADEARFIRTWIDNPVLTGAVSPSGRFLARMMARAVDPNGTGPIVELGPGTGPITQALLKRGVDPRRLLLVEFDGAFCRLLRKRFPGVQVVQADAYALRDSMKNVLVEPADAVVSSLPLLNKPDAQRLALLDDAFALMVPNGNFVQFTYGMNSPVPRDAASAYEADVSPPVWLNLPPARVWIYRRKGEDRSPAFDVSPRDAKQLGLRASETGIFRPSLFRPAQFEPKAARRAGLFRKRRDLTGGTLGD
jgi:phosphatidylethanolamine/phosphatidyl-N-methylethanolamine N-methyltransferase